jgi:hypothetical protein
VWRQQGRLMRAGVAGLFREDPLLAHPAAAGENARPYGGIRVLTCAAAPLSNASASGAGESSCNQKQGALVRHKYRHPQPGVRRFPGKAGYGERIWDTWRRESRKAWAGRRKPWAESPSSL